MLDHLSYGARIDCHTLALKELFSQIKQNRDIHIKDVKITEFEGGDWKDFILQAITYKRGGTEIFGYEDRPFTDEELSLMLNFLKEELGDLFRKQLEKENLIPRGI